jgi:hypothetical protein
MVVEAANTRPVNPLEPQERFAAEDAQAEAEAEKLSILSPGMPNTLRQAAAFRRSTLEKTSDGTILVYKRGLNAQGFLAKTGELVILSGEDLQSGSQWIVAAYQVIAESPSLFPALLRAEGLVEQAARMMKPKQAHRHGH